MKKIIYTILTLFLLSANIMSVDASKIPTIDMICNDETKCLHVCEYNSSDNNLEINYYPNDGNFQLLVGYRESEEMFYNIGYFDMAKRYPTLESIFTHDELYYGSANDFNSTGFNCPNNAYLDDNTKEICFDDDGKTCHKEAEGLFDFTKYDIKFTIDIKTLYNEYQNRLTGNYGNGIDPQRGWLVEYAKTDLKLDIEYLESPKVSNKQYFENKFIEITDDYFYGGTFPSYVDQDMLIEEPIQASLDRINRDRDEIEPYIHSYLILEYYSDLNDMGLMDDYHIYLNDFIANNEAIYYDLQTAFGKINVINDDLSKEEVEALINSGELSTLTNGFISNLDNNIDETFSGLAADFVGYLDKMKENNTLFGNLPDCDSLLGQVGDETSTAYWLDLILRIMSYVGIVALIVLTIIEYVRAIATHDSDSLSKANKKTMYRLFYTVLLFLFPTVLEFLFEIMGVYTSSDVYCMLK